MTPSILGPGGTEAAGILAEQVGAPPEPPPASRNGRASLILSNAGANIARQASAFLIILVLPPLLVRSLDRATYSIWLLILQIAGYITFVDNGVQNVVARYVSLERETTGSTGVARVITNTIALLSLLAGFGILLFATCSSLLAWLLPGQPPALLIPAEHALLITAISAALALPFAVLAGMFVGDQRSGVNALAVTMGKIAGAGGVAWVAVRHGGLEAMAVALAAGTVLQSLLYIAAARFRQTAKLFVWRLVEWRSMREILTFSIGMMVTQLAGLLISGMDLPMVSAFDFPQAAFYGLALTASNLLLIPYNAVTAPLMPLVTTVHAKGDALRLGQVVIEITRWANLFLALVALFLAMSLPSLLHWWVRQEYAAHALPLAEILILAQAIRLSCAPYAMAGFSAGRQAQMLVSPVGEGLINLVCSFIGAKWIGAPGVALGSVAGALAGVLLQLLVNIDRTQDVMQIDRVRFLLRGILKPLLSVAPVAPVFFLGRLWASTPAKLFFLAIACSLLSLPLAILWGLEPEDRSRLKGYLSGWTNRFV